MLYKAHILPFKRIHPQLCSYGNSVNPYFFRAAWMYSSR